MSPSELKRCRQTLGLTQSELARLLRLAPGGDRSIRHYEAAKRPIPGPISVVLDMLCNDHDPLEEFEWGPVEVVRLPAFPHHGTDSGRRKP